MKSAYWKMTVTYIVIDVHLWHYRLVQLISISGNSEWWRPPHKQRMLITENCHFRRWKTPFRIYLYTLYSFIMKFLTKVWLNAIVHVSSKSSLLTTDLRCDAHDLLFFGRKISWCCRNRWLLANGFHINESQQKICTQLVRPTMNSPILKSSRVLIDILWISPSEYSVVYSFSSFISGSSMTVCSVQLLAFCHTYQQMWVTFRKRYA